MREIKFRAWIATEKRMFTMYNEGFFAHAANNSDWPVMQFTGLFDKNDVAIYEGDILSPEAYLKRKEFHNEVVCRKGMFCFAPNITLHSPVKPLYKSLDLGDAAKNAYEIIGNIYQNPELLCKNNATE